MASLLIVLENNNWVARVANTDVVYPFEGADADAQATMIQQMARAMADGHEDGYDFFFDVPDDVNIEEQLFATTDGIVYTDRVVWAAYDDDVTVLTDIAEAGEALLAAL